MPLFDSEFPGAVAGQFQLTLRLTVSGDGRSLKLRIRNGSAEKSEAVMAKEKTAKQKVTFSLLAPAAKSVQLAGDFTGWNQAPVVLKKLKSGLWKTVVSLPPGRYEFRYLVDGQWCNDPEWKIRHPNQFGGENCVCLVK